ncbi:MAG: hypothetical protein AWU57_513 [Marinobacter sp. T13-3]|nr:MAG: hypothetical protein AWU57_513 [Marinobacter sp. T13-3]
MSTIGAKTFFFYEGDNPPGEVVISRPDYFLSPDVTLPESGLTLLYGHRGPGNLIGSATRYAAQNDMGIGLVEVRVDVGEWNPNKARFEGFDQCRVLNLPARASKEVMDDVNEKWNTWLKEEGHGPGKFPRSPSRHMHLLDRLMREAPYNKLNAVVYDAKTTFGLARFVTIFNEHALDSSSVMVVPRNMSRVSFQF